MVGERDTGIAQDPLQLPGEAERGRETDPAPRSVGETERGNADDDGATGRGAVGDSDVQVARQHLVCRVGPAQGSGGHESSPRSFTSIDETLPDADRAGRIR
ncbi:hypothetical protein GCM10010264_18680 [Streptomyces globisporus]|nr:hypothetical protein GCM10010264_18680 [Streptomyces globisporus]